MFVTYACACLHHACMLAKDVCCPWEVFTCTFTGERDMKKVKAVTIETTVSISCEKCKNKYSRNI